MKGSRTVKNSYKSSVYRGLIRKETKTEKRRGGRLDNRKWQQDCTCLLRNSCKPSIYRDFTTNRQGVGNKMVIVTIV